MKKLRVLSVSTALMLVLSGCSTISDVSDGVVDVTESVVDTVFGRDDDTAAQAEDAPGADDEFPTLADVPDRPAKPVIASEYRKLTSGLVSDNQNAKYSDEVIRNGQVSTVDIDSPLTSVRQAAAEPANITSQTTTIKQNIGAATGSAIQAGAGVVKSVPQVGGVNSNGVTQANRVNSNLSTSNTTSVPQGTAQIKNTSASLNSGALNPGTLNLRAPATVQETFENSSFAGIETRYDPSVTVNADYEGLGANRAEEVAQNGSHVATLYYDMGSASLSNLDQDVLRQVAEIYRTSGVNGVVVIGHASLPVSAGAANPALVNYKMSLDRATRVTRQLQKLGVASDAILMDARGANSPVRLGNTPEDHAFNQRTEIYFQN